jgi:hypothetical protein
VLVGSYSQLFATAQAAAFQNRAPIGCRHALAESMHAHTAADFRLVRTFWHSSFLTLKILLWVWSAVLNMQYTNCRLRNQQLNIF